MLYFLRNKCDIVSGVQVLPSDNMEPSAVWSTLGLERSGLFLASATGSCVHGTLRRWKQQQWVHVFVLTRIPTLNLRWSIVLMSVMITFAHPHIVILRCATIFRFVRTLALQKCYYIGVFFTLVSPRGQHYHANTCRYIPNRICAVVNNLGVRPDKHAAPVVV